MKKLMLIALLGATVGSVWGAARAGAERANFKVTNNSGETALIITNLDLGPAFLKLKPGQVGFIAAPDYPSAEEAKQLNDPKYINQMKMIGQPVRDYRKAQPAVVFLGETEERLFDGDSSPFKQKFLERMYAQGYPIIRAFQLISDDQFNVLPNHEVTLDKNSVVKVYSPRSKNTYDKKLGKHWTGESASKNAAELITRIESINKADDERQKQSGYSLALTPVVRSAISADAVRESLKKANEEEMRRLR